MATTDAENADFESTETSPLLQRVSDPTSRAPSATASTGLEQNRPRPPRNVTFNANPVSKTIEPSYTIDNSTRPSRQTSHHPASPQSPSAISVGGLGGGPMASLKTNLRRRNSQGPSANTLTAAGGPGSSSALGLAVAGGVLAGTAAAVGAAGAGPGAAAAGSLPKIGPQRSTKKAQKLKLLPNPEVGEDGPDEESGRDVYSQFTRIKDPTARRDAKRLGKADRDRLPRVTAYCTANEYDMQGLLRFLKGRGRTSRGANPKLIDECIYTPYSYGTKQAELVPAEVRSTPERRHSTGEVVTVKDLLDLAEERPMALGNGSLHDGGRDLLGSGMADEGAIAEDAVEFDITVHTPEVFLFEYGVIVVWGMSAAHEQRFLKELAKFEKEKLAPDDVETENFNFYYTREYGARIYNDFITLLDKNNYMIKLAISHALAQSVKTSLFEELIASTIETCKDLPTQIALTGKISLSRSQINMQIGELFILRINIHLNGSVLDTPELFWVEPQLEPVYQAVRSYLEMDQRVGLLTERLDVIADLLAVLKDQLSHGHGEMLEWIVIILIAAEILVATINIVVDLYAGVD